MKCPICDNELNVKDFFNVSLTYVCPLCKKELVFSPSLVPLILMVMGSYFIWSSIPPLSNILYDFILGFVVVFLLMMIILRLLLVLKLGKIVEQTRNKK